MFKCILHLSGEFLLTDMWKQISKLQIVLLIVSKDFFNLQQK